MRWQQIKELKEGDTRLKTRFLLFPKLIDGEWRWLEVTKYKQKYRHYYDISGDFFDWEDINWMN